MSQENAEQMTEVSVTPASTTRAVVVGQDEMESILDQFDPLSIKSGSSTPPPAPPPQPLEQETAQTEGDKPSEEILSSQSSLEDTSGSQPKAETTSGAPSNTEPPNTRDSAMAGDNQAMADEVTEEHSELKSFGPNDDDKPFDFQRFLGQLKHKSADPIARYLKSFLTEFTKKTWTTNEQVKIIGDFKAFISAKMDQCPPFSTLSDNEFRNALEGMEKLIMNRLYTHTFSPEIPDARRSDDHEEDVLRDRVLEEKMRIWHWIEGRHLDITERFLKNGESFVKLASDELLKINHYRAPRDKVICILNCCKVIFGLLRQTNSEESADGFLPILIYVVIKAQPKDLISNVNYIQRFRNPDRLNGESGYYLSSLVGAISFIETLDRSSLSITEQEFEQNVESSVKSIAQDRSEADHPPKTPDLSNNPGLRSKSPAPGAGTLTPSAVLYNSAGLLSGSLKSLTKLFEDQAEAEPNANATASTGATATATANTDIKREASPSPQETAARQISAEEDEARRISSQEFENVSDTLSQMFPTLDREIIQDVLREKQGRVGAAVDVCLALVGTA
ncbi:vacuolar protein sorting-associated protein 9 [Trichomonascus vanleenenianus]|uniref:vacuolar protein sorting-associated protein 9 n=1 Tax=Trichomonascus vanleenenianus TaxID=2268995 RepID=UPI003ECA8C9D